MNLSRNSIIIWGLSKYGHPWTLAEYQRRSRLLLEALLEVDPLFGGLATVGSERIVPLSKELAGLEELIGEQVFDLAQVMDYSRLSADGQLELSSICKSGFALSYCSYDASLAAPQVVSKGGVYLRLIGCSASIEPDASVVIELSHESAAASNQPQLLQKTLQLLIEHWGCNVAGIAPKAYEQIIRASDRASYAGQWLFYLPFPSLANCLPPDIRREPFAKGILIETTPHMPDANNPADVAAGLRVRDVLDEFGLINDATYAIEGWPTDHEELTYVQFISGAPMNRKYTVHCINFDGYDPDRKVLLYAKLFRRLRRHPKEWGLRGWDGPVLNEAKRQVIAAAKAGGVPIEWHIGLEEPAEQVRQLLSDYTDITEQQLQVIYTPLSEALASPL